MSLCICLCTRTCTTLFDAPPPFCARADARQASAAPTGSVQVHCTSTCAEGGNHLCKRQVQLSSQYSFTRADVPLPGRALSAALLFRNTCSVECRESHLTRREGGGPRGRLTVRVESCGCAVLSARTGCRLEYRELWGSMPARGSGNSAPGSTDELLNYKSYSLAVQSLHSHMIFLNQFPFYRNT